MNLNEIIQAAQGGQGVNNLASQFGISPDQAQAAIQALTPAFSAGLQNTIQNPEGLGGLASHLASSAHLGSYQDPNQAAAATGAGSDALSQIFGSQNVVARLSQHASQISGVDPQTIQQMMPVVASLVVGGLAHSLNANGFGNLLGQLAGAAAAPGGLAATLDQAGASPAAGGLFGGLVQSVLGGLFGGAQGGAQPAGATAPALQAGLSALVNMLQPGVQVSEAHQQGLNSILQGSAGRG
ncbi:MAG: DUF937 domain-containing protein [Hyphomicrobiales bacterium]|nr:DUF937 domain-containing protein [Hyphomicrobiales bacterium]MBV8664752.1 DUF937 domain-containing protein [Hyphomicrobiales bacterium]